MANVDPLVNSQSRVFLIEGGARPDHKPSYESCMRAQGLSKDFGDVTKIECPDPSKYGSFVQVGEVRGEEGSMSTTLEGRFAIDVRSTLLRLAEIGCTVDVQIHTGACEDPSSFNSFKKAIVLEGSIITNYGTDELGALASGDQAAVNETSDLSADEAYEVMPIEFGLKGEDLIGAEMIDVVVADTRSCSECEEASDGCQKFYAVSIAEGGSPSTPADVVFSVDGGTTILAHDIDSMNNTDNPTGIAKVGDYIVVISNDQGGHNYALASEFNAVDDPDFTAVTDGYVAGGEPNDIWSIGTTAFVCGDGGYIYIMEDGTAAVEVLDAGSATTDNLNAIKALSDEFIIAVGDSGAVVYTTNGTTFAEATRPVGAGVDLLAVCPMSETVWLVGTSTGLLYYTIDSGVTWTLKGFPGSGSGVVRDIDISKDSVLVLAHDTTTPRGRIIQSLDGGYSWTVLPRSTATMPLTDRFNAVAICAYDPNFVVGCGLGDDGTDGALVVGA